MKSLALAGLLCAAVFPLPALAGSNVPDWVKAAAALPSLTYPASTRAVALLDDTTVTVAPDGTTTTHYRSVVRVLRQQGRNDAVAGAWTDVDQKLNYIHAWSIGPTGIEYAVKDSEFLSTQAGTDGMLYESPKLKAVLPPAADPGAVIAYEYERRDRPYVREEGWQFQQDLPVVHTSFELDLPAGWKYYSAWLRYPPVDPIEVGVNHYRWELHNVPALNTEDVVFAPAQVGMAGRMAVHYSDIDLPDASGRWAEIGNWYGGLALPQSLATAEITAKAQQLAAGETDFTKKLQSITEYLQKNIRYVGIEVGIGGLRPHAASDVFHNQYGDCKDKATLLKTIFGAIGIDATWVMVDSHRGVVDPSLPSTFGNHMISAIRVPEGYKNPLLQAVVKDREGVEYLIFDPTDQWTPVGQLHVELQGSYGVLVNGKNSQVIQLPTLSPEASVLDRSAKFDLSVDGGLTGSITESRTGDLAWRTRILYTEGSVKEQRETMERRLQQSFTSFTLNSSAVENISQMDKPVVLKYVLSAPGYARMQGPLMLVRPRIMGLMSMELDDKPRTFPVDLGGTRTERSTVEIQLPPGFKVDELPDPVTIDTAFGTYQSKIEVQGTLLRSSRELVIHQLELEPGQYQKLRQFMGSVREDEDSVIVLKKQ